MGNCKCVATTIIGISFIFYFSVVVVYNTFKKYIIEYYSNTFEIHT